MLMCFQINVKHTTLTQKAREGFWYDWWHRTLYTYESNIKKRIQVIAWPSLYYTWYMKFKKYFMILFENYILQPYLSLKISTCDNAILSFWGLVRKCLFIHWFELYAIAFSLILINSKFQLYLISQFFYILFKPKIERVL